MNEWVSECFVEIRPIEGSVATENLKQNFFKSKIFFKNAHCVLENPDHDRKPLNWKESRAVVSIAHNEPFYPTSCLLIRCRL